MAKIYSGIMCLSLLLAWLPTPGGRPETEGANLAQDGHSAFLDNYFGAFNARDLEAMRSMWADDISWVHLQGTLVVHEGHGADSLSAEMHAYFVTHAPVRSGWSNLMSSGDLATFVETAAWHRDGAIQRQEALAIYEVRGGKIHRFWYVAK